MVIQNKFSSLFFKYRLMWVLTEKKGIPMSKARARERKKKRLARAHETGAGTTPAAVAEQKHNPGKFNAQLNKGGKGGKNIPSPAASSRGAARSG